ncbi:uncharacterized protein [Argopecten irradians]|uniref:uncharacterized protein n=1 Tax=Argopecten irradians TaxID=31199 RepID=UPI00371C28D3
MVEKILLVALITGFTATIVTVWITVDFCLYRRKKAAIRAAKADTFARRPHSERIVQPFQKKNGKEKKAPPNPNTKNKRSNVKKFVNFITRKKAPNESDNKDPATDKNADKSISGTVNRESAFTAVKVDAGGSKPSSSKSDEKEIKKNGISNGHMSEKGGQEPDIRNHASTNGSALSDLQSAPNIGGKWTNALPSGKKGLPPIKGQTATKSNKEEKPSFHGDHVKQEKTGDNGIGQNETNIELAELKFDKVNSKPPFKQRPSKTKLRTEGDVSSPGIEQKSEHKVNAKELPKKPPLLKRISRNRVDSVNDGSASSTDTRETFVDDRGTSSTSSSWTCDETSRKRTGSLSDSTTSSGSIELEKRKFRLKPLKRNQSNMSVSDTTPLT